MHESHKLTHNTDVAIIGAGVTGLMLSKKLSGLGIATALIDKSPTVANGPSTKNEGWLHRGTYHSQSITNREDAIKVARRCIYGHEQIKSYAPEAIEEPMRKSYALVRDIDRVDEVLSRWDEAEVLYKSVLLREVANTNPNTQIQNFVEAFQVADVGINTPILYRKLLAESKKNGTKIFLGNEPTIPSLYELEVLQDDEILRIAAPIIIHTTGYGMKKFFKDNLDMDLLTRFWKSHLLVIPRIAEDDIFCLDPGESGMMNHGSHTIIGANEDAVLSKEPTFEPIPEKVASVYEAMSRLFKVNSNLDFMAVACLKVDLPELTAQARSLNIKVAEPIPNHLCVLPGKMTESPYVSDMVTQEIINRLSNSPVTNRPCDEFEIEREYATP